MGDRKSKPAVNSTEKRFKKKEMQKKKMTFSVCPKKGEGVRIFRGEKEETEKERLSKRVRVRLGGHSIACQTTE